jgi:mannose-6-phosphate isomerase-like protein (cupin superfamily)
MGYTIKNLLAVDDMAAKRGFGEMGDVRFAREDLEAQGTGIAHQHLRPGKRQQFGHHHSQAEEIYLVLSGSGRVKLDEEIQEISRMDAVRVAPETTRAFEAGPEGLEFVVFGPHFAGDGEIVPGWWSD